MICMDIRAKSHVLLPIDDFIANWTLHEISKDREICELLIKKGILKPGGLGRLQSLLYNWEARVKWEHPTMERQR